MFTPTPIGPFVTGWDTDDTPWKAPPDSFQEIDNCHIKHGFIEKRQGFGLLGYMTHNPTTVTYPSITGITQANPGVVTVTSATGLANDQIIVIYNVAGMVDVNNVKYLIKNLVGLTFNLADLDGNLINTTTFGAWTAGGVVMLTPGYRMMGINRFYAGDGSKETIAFDTRRAAIFDGANNRFNPLDTADIFDSDDSNYVWSDNWQASNLENRMYFTNGKEWNGTNLNGIRYYSSSTPTVTVLFTPTVRSSVSRVLYGAKFIFFIKQRMIVLSTFEREGAGSVTSHPQRARWCAFQSPNNWEDTVPGGGGYVDAPTGQQIISARYLRDFIVVFFTDSVWAIKVLSDPKLPFRWEKINDYRACGGQFASVSYDRFVPSIGQRGITITDGVETKKVDERIQSFVSESIDGAFFYKVYCARDYTNDRFWTLYPSSDNKDGEIDKALIYDDDSKGYTTYSLALNVLGYGSIAIDLTLADFTAQNQLDISIFEGEENTLQSYYFQKGDEIFLGGTIDGIVYTLSFGLSSEEQDIEMTFTTASWNPFFQEGAQCRIGYVDFYIDSDKRTECEVQFFKDDNVNPYTTQRFNCLPNLDFISIITQIYKTNPIVIDTPSHGLTTGNTVYIYGVNGMIELTEGPHTVTVINPNQISLDGVNATTYSTYTGSGSLYYREFYRDRIVKRVYGGGVGYQHYLKLITNGKDRIFTLHQMKPYFAKTGKRVPN